MKFLAYISTPPLFEDEDETRTAALLHFILLSTIVITVLQILVNAFSSQNSLLVPVNLFSLPVLIGLIFLMRFRHLRLSASILLIFLWSIISFNSYTSIGILNPVFSAQALTIIVAGLLLNGKIAFFVTGLSSAFGLWLTYAAEAGLYINRVGDVSVRQAWVDETAFFVLTALFMVLSLRVIREARLRVEEQTRKQHHSDERYKLLIENAPATIATLDPNHRINFLNRDVIETVETMQQRSVYEFVLPEWRERYHDALNRVFEQGSIEQLEIQAMRPNDQVVWLSVRFAPIHENGHVVEAMVISTDITEHKQTEKALQESEEQYRRLFEANPHPMAVTDLETLKFLAVNDAALKHYGYSHEEFMLLTAASLRVHAEEASVRNEAETFRQQPSSYLSKVITQHLKKDGTIIWVEITGHRVNYNGHDSVVSTAYDLTDRLKTEEALRNSEEQYRELFESNPHPMVISDLETATILAANDAAVSKYGYSHEEFVGMHGTMLRVPDEIPDLVNLYNKVKKEDLIYVPPGVSRQLKKDGTIIFAEVSAHRLNYQGRKAIMAVGYDLTERLRAEQALRESENRLSGIVESAMDAIITVDDQQNIVNFNAAAETMFKCRSGEVIGKSISQFIPARFRNVHGNHIRNFGQTGVTNRRMGALSEISALRSNNQEFPVEASISQFENGGSKFYTVILRDITQRKQAEEEIRRSEALFSTIFQSVPVAIGIVSLATLKTLSVNEYMLKLTGYNSSEIVGTFVDQSPYWNNSDQWNTLSQPLQNGQVSNGVEMQWHTKTGQSLTMLGSAIPIEVNGEPCMLGIALDITERKQAERIRLEVYKERELVEVKARFISTMSHEFRTPLTVIMSAKETLQRYYDRLTVERRAEHFANIQNQVRYVTNLLDEVLTLSKAQAGKMSFNPAAMNLSSFCQTLFEQMQTTDSTHHEFNFVTDGLIGEIAGDINLLQHVLVNLLSNAIKYSPEGGEVRFELHRNGDQATIRISDQGIGIPEEDQKHLFEPFYRATNTGTIKGTGLGLAIVKESVEAHGGTINVISAPGEGTTFVVRLPLAATA